jgi:hypothetical protein
MPALANQTDGLRNRKDGAQSIVFEPQGARHGEKPFGDGRSNLPGGTFPNQLGKAGCIQNHTNEPSTAIMPFI